MFDLDSISWNSSQLLKDTLWIGYWTFGFILFDGTTYRCIETENWTKVKYRWWVKYWQDAHSHWLLVWQSSPIVTLVLATSASCSALYRWKCLHDATVSRLNLHCLSKKDPNFAMIRCILRPCTFFYQLNILYNQSALKITEYAWRCYKKKKTDFFDFYWVLINNRLTMYMLINYLFFKYQNIDKTHKKYKYQYMPIFFLNKLAHVLLVLEPLDLFSKSFSKYLISSLSF